MLVSVRPQNVSLLNFCAYLISAALTINALVWANSSVIFVLSYLCPTKDHAGDASFAGTLLLVDEAISLLLVIIWGRLVDKISLRFVAAMGHLIAALGLFAISQSRQRTQLLAARLLFAVGHSALTTVLSAGFALVTTAAISKQPSTSVSASEREPLLQAEYMPVSQETAEAGSKSKDAPVSVLAGIAGLAAGCGALLAVFVFLPMPPRLAGKHHLGLGVEKTYLIVAALEIFAAVVAFLGLKVDQKPIESVNHTSWRNLVKHELSRLFKGFALAKDRPLLVSYLSGLVARAQTVVVALCVPIFVNAYYINSGRCKLDDPSLPPEEVKQGCHAAFAFAAALTGTIQTAGLIISPLAGWAGRNRSSLWLCIFATSGCLGFLAYALLPNGDPTRFAISIPASLAIGAAQTGLSILSLALVAKARARLVREQEAGGGDSGEIAGAISAAASFFSGLGVIVVGQVSGLLADVQPTAPFVLVCALNIGLIIVIQAAQRWRVK